MRAPDRRHPLFKSRTYRIAAGAAASGIARGRTTIHVAAGFVWITVAGSLDDYWLRAGQALDVPAGHLVVCEAVGAPALLELVRRAGRRDAGFDRAHRPAV